MDGASRVGEAANQSSVAVTTQGTLPLLHAWAWGLTSFELGLLGNVGPLPIPAGVSEDAPNIHEFYEVSLDSPSAPSGGFGVVLSAQHKSTKTPCILKMVDKKEAGEEYRIHLLENGGKDELLRMSREDPNPNVVQFFDVLECPELYYVVMEPLHGLDLLDQIEKDFPVTESYCRDVMRQVCSALQFLHSSVGIYHRDVKLENFRYRDSFEKRGTDSSNLGDLVLVDFGFAHFIHKPWDRRVCGTLMYLAPEATRAAKFPEHADSQGGYSCAVDLWAAGVVLYIVLTGQPPFEDEDIWALGKIGGKGSEILAKALNCSNLATVSDEAVSLLRGLLELDPQTRITIDQALQHPWFGLTEEQLSANKISVPPESYQLVKQVSRQSSQISMDSFAD